MHISPLLLAVFLFYSSNDSCFQLVQSGISFEVTQVEKSDYQKPDYKGSGYKKTEYDSKYKDRKVKKASDYKESGYEKSSYKESDYKKTEYNSKYTKDHKVKTIKLETPKQNLYINLFLDGSTDKVYNNNKQSDYKEGLAYKKPQYSRYGPDQNVPKVRLEGPMSNIFIKEIRSELNKKNNINNNYASFLPPIQKQKIYNRRPAAPPLFRMPPYRPKNRF